MKYIVILILMHLMTVDLIAQELKAVHPMRYPQTEKIRGDNYVYYPEYGIKVDYDHNVYIEDSLVYTCEFPEYYVYLIETFGDDILLISPLKASKGWSLPYQLDRELLLVFNLANGQRYYADASRIKKIELPVSFECYEKYDDTFTISSIDMKSMKIMILQGGEEITEIELPIYQF